MGRVTTAHSTPRRRQLRFASLEEVVADAERLVAAGNAKTVGNWSLDRLLMHLAVAIDGSIDGVPGQANRLLRIVGPLVKAWVFRRGLSPGVRLPVKLEAIAFPPGASAAEALGRLRVAIERTKSQRMTARHPVFGKLTHEEWNLFHLRHAELHLSFALV